MNTEGVSLSFAPDAVDRLAEIAAQVNERQENIGARRLHTVLERLLDTLSFEAPDKSGTVAIDRAYVDKHLGELVQDQDRSEEHTSELQSLMRNSYAVFCLKKKI